MAEDGATESVAREADASWRLRVSADGRRVERADGAPWFWLGDTAWDLFIRLTREDLQHYFADRSARGPSAPAALRRHSSRPAPR